MIYDSKFQYDVIGFLNIYCHDPWDLPGLSKIGEREWYFFVPRDRKHGSGGRPNGLPRMGSGSHRLRSENRQQGGRVEVNEEHHTSPSSSPLSSSMETNSFCSPKEALVTSMAAPKSSREIEEAMEEEKISDKRVLSSVSLQLPLGSENYQSFKCPKCLATGHRISSGSVVQSLVPESHNYANILNSSG
ncbi:hypothetical protein F3Y22_tig00112206pilonHSYRG00008 [Hibiscus syriacus]|uniref:NAC domain-containing protein n=1 Tax=Hibiscus syriacus TaxID=106335 RepID=A0A6A2YBK3_HIBSY|nr:hypothetical protein F3Y22_tig00112206pilonHSYRG00008 [Hibiscus syriacus]